MKGDERSKRVWHEFLEEVFGDIMFPLRSIADWLPPFIGWIPIFILIMVVVMVGVLLGMLFGFIPSMPPS